jgi:hypothetical protein
VDQIEVDIYENRTFVHPVNQSKPSPTPAWCSNTCHGPSPGTRPGKWDDLDEKLAPDRRHPKFTNGRAAPTPKQPAVDPSQRRINAYTLNLTPIVIVEKRGQAFANYATKWELRHSAIASYDAPFKPIVDDQFMVVGHIGMVNGRELISVIPDNSMTATMKRGPVYVAGLFGNHDWMKEPTPKHWHRFRFISESYLVRTDVYGHVSAAELGKDGQALKQDLIDDIIIDVLADLPRRAITHGIKSLVSRIVARRVAREAGEELAEELLKKEVITHALERLQKTAINALNEDVVRSSEAVAGRQVFRHTLSSANIPGTYAFIERDGSLILSKGVANAQYGEGVYAWAKEATQVGKYIDIEIAGDVAVETLQFTKRTFYRLVPAQGNRLPVRIVGTNLTPDEIAFGRKMVGR